MPVTACWCWDEILKPVVWRCAVVAILYDEDFDYTDWLNHLQELANPLECVSLHSLLPPCTIDCPVLD